MAVLEGGEPTIIVNAEGDRTTPSVVGFRADGDRIVGKAAKNQAVTNPTNTVFSIKRFMGRRYDEVTSELKTIPYKVKAGTGSRGVVEIEGEDFTPRADQRDDSLQDEGRRPRSTLARPSPMPSSPYPHTSMTAQRQATKDAGRSPDSTSSASSTSPRPLLLPMVSTRRTSTRRSSSSTLVEAPRRLFARPR